MTKKITVILSLFLFSVTTFAAGKVFFISPKNGAKVEQKFKAKFGLAKGLTIKPAGQDPNNSKWGHHHIIIDGAGIPAGMVIPADSTHLHYGKGQTEADLELPSGKHKLTLQFADGAHRSYGDEFSETIEVDVK